MYATCEMWMMVQKARLFGDEQVAREMLRTRDPKACKALGRKVKNFDDATWDKRMFSFFWRCGVLCCVVLCCGADALMCGLC